jgi:hypothetical protein
MQSLVAIGACTDFQRMRRLALYFLPATGVAAAIIGAFYGWIGIQAVRGGAGWFGILLVVFGIGGIALGIALMNAWRTFAERMKRANDLERKGRQ